MPRFRGSLPMRSIEQGSGSSIYSLKEDVLNKVRLSYCVCFSFVGGCGSFSLRETHRFYLCVFLCIFSSTKCQSLVFILDQFKFIKGVLHYIAEGDGKVHVRNDGVLILLRGTHGLMYMRFSFFQARSAKVVKSMHQENE